MVQEPLEVSKQYMQAAVPDTNSCAPTPLTPSLITRPSACGAGKAPSAGMPTTAKYSAFSLPGRTGPPSNAFDKHGPASGAVWPAQPGLVEDGASAPKVLQPPTSLSGYLVSPFWWARARSLSKVDGVAQETEHAHSLTDRQPEAGNGRPGGLSRYFSW